MIVTCNNCDTSFQLDDARVPEQGIRVRCSRCKEAFFLAHPSAGGSQAIHDVAEAAAAGEAAPKPTATQDLSGPVASPGQSAGPGSPGSDDEEHDWEFNVDPAPVDPNAESSIGLDFGEVPGAKVGDVEDDGAGSGLSLEGEEEDAGPPIERASDSAFGSVDDYSSLMPEDDAASNPPATLPAEDGPPVAAPVASVALAGRYAESGSSEDLGDPESWDFFGEENADGSSAAPAPGAVLGRIALTTPGANALVDPDSLPDSLDWDEDPYEDAAEVGQPGIILRTLGAFGHTIGWVATLSLVSVALVSGFWSTAESLVSTPQDLRIGSIEAKGIVGRWVDTSRGETLLRVRGELVNTSDAVTVLDGILEVALLDANGLALEVDPQPAGLVLGDEEVRELAPRALRIAVDRAAWALSQERLQPARAVPFHAIFRDVPSSATRFAVAVADGSVVGTDGALDEVGVPEAVAIDGPVPLAPAQATTPTEAAPRRAVEAATAQAAPAAQVSPAAQAPPAAPADRGSVSDELTWGE